MAFDENKTKIEELTRDVEQIKRTVQNLESASRTQQIGSSPINRTIGTVDKKILEDTITDSIIDIVWNKYFYYNTYFESLDGWNLQDTSAGSSIVSRLGVHLVTGASTNDISSIDKEPVYQNVLSFDVESRFASAIFVNTVSAIEAFVGVGFVNNGATGEHYGFFIDDSTLYGTCANGTSQTTVALMTITTNHPTTVDPIYFVEARFYPGSKVEFYVKTDYSGVFIHRGTITTNLPKGAMFEWLSAQVKTTTTSAAEIRFGNMEYIQRRIPR